MAGVIAGLLFAASAVLSAPAQSPAQLAQLDGVVSQLPVIVTRDADNPGRNVFTLRKDTSTGGVASWTVPAAKRYVIEQFTVDCATPTSTSILDAELVTIVGGTTGFYHFPVHYAENIGFGLSRFGGTGAGPFYADPGTTISALANVASRSNADFRGCSFIVSGHVINNP
jgi:hypothetical protein